MQYRPSNFDPRCHSCRDPQREYPDVYCYHDDKGDRRVITVDDVLPHAPGYDPELAAVAAGRMQRVSSLISSFRAMANAGERDIAARIASFFVE